MADNNPKQLFLFQDLPYPGSNTVKKNEAGSHWVIQVDGASRGNPGPAGAGIYFTRKGSDAKHEKFAFFLGAKTNNQAEYLALALAVLIFRDTFVPQEKQIGMVQIVSDSELLIKQMQGLYKVKNQVLAEIKLMIENVLCSYQHSFKHVLREYNKVADKMANIAVDEKRKIPDELLKQLKHLSISLP